MQVFPGFHSLALKKGRFSVWCLLWVMGSEMTGKINNHEKIIVYTKRQVVWIEECVGKHLGSVHEGERLKRFFLT